MRAAAMALVGVLAVGCSPRVLELGADGGVTSPADARPTCRFADASGNKCVVCAARGMDEQVVACLTCESVPPAELCRVCRWDDDPDRPCRQCMSTDRRSVMDECEPIRTEIRSAP